MQWWIGNATIYDGANTASRELMHWRILHNQAPPGGSWESVGSNGINIRVGAVYLAEWLRALTGLRLTTTYALIDTVSLCAFLPLLFVFVRHWASRATSVIAVTSYAALLPLTYFLYAYHPWDRLSALTWLAGLWLIATNRPWWLAALLLPASLMKYDVSMLAFVYWLAWIDRKHWLRVSFLTILCIFTGIGTFIALLIMLPGGFETRSMLEQVATNLQVLRTLPVAWPPLLFLAPLVIPVWTGLRRGERIIRVFAAFGVCFIVFAALTANMAEVTSFTPAILSFLPAAAVGVEAMLAPGPARRDRRPTPERTTTSRVGTEQRTTYTANR